MAKKSKKGRRRKAKDSLAPRAAVPKDGVPTKREPRSDAPSTAKRKPKGANRDSKRPAAPMLKLRPSQAGELAPRRDDDDVADSLDDSTEGSPDSPLLGTTLRTVSPPPSDNSADRPSNVDVEELPDASSMDDETDEPPDPRDGDSGVDDMDLGTSHLSFFVDGKRLSEEAAAAAEGGDQDSESTRPLVSDHQGLTPISPKLLARRQRMQKWVAGGAVVAAAAAIFLLARAKFATPDGSVAHRSAAAHTSGPEASAVVSAAATQPAKAPVKTAPHDEPATADTDTPESEAADAAGSAEVEAPIDAKAQKKAVLSLLNKGAFGAAVEPALALVAVSPTEAMSYLLLGTAYQGLGKGKEALKVYSDCVRQSKTGPVHECRSMGGKP